MRNYILIALIVCSTEMVQAATESSIADKTQQLFDAWQPKLADAGLRAVVSAPYVIAGDGGVTRLGRYRDGTVLAAARALKGMYFEKDPPEPILILLFESEGPYRRLAKKWFDEDNVPHYGFYRHADRVMFMNVATGTGTLVHELTHALIAPDFPAVPSWFNEGLASLYEQCSIDGDTIQGHENWRLPGLQKAIRGGTLRPLKELIEDPSFYRGDLVGINYAQARYLMFYLQEHKLLQTYYRHFRDGVKEDPTGLKTLRSVLAPQSLEDFDKQWRAWVMELRFE